MLSASRFPSRPCPSPSLRLSASPSRLRPCPVFVSVCVRPPRAPPLFILRPLPAYNFGASACPAPTSPHNTLAIPPRPDSTRRPAPCHLLCYTATATAAPRAMHMSTDALLPSPSPRLDAKTCLRGRAQLGLFALSFTSTSASLSPPLVFADSLFHARSSSFIPSRTLSDSTSTIVLVSFPPSPSCPLGRTATFVQNAKWNSENACLQWS
ncbi:hypothetical protein C2E23DRAFT_272059 [Lenzites betulinus]|nr:hypothetical protein C2E23DRAFT_272059 [Lenzites betulinus]